MNKNYRVNLSEVRETELKQVLLSVEEACRDLEIDFYIIGALARDIWFEPHGIIMGGTKDIDFAVRVGQEDQFYALKELLITKHRFGPFRGNAFVLFAPNKIQIDILPFGGIEVNDGVVVTGEGLREIKVNGFKEVFKMAVHDVRVLENNEFKVATLPGIILLKLIAFDDRPEQRAKDPLDIRAIIEHYFELQSDLIYEAHNDLFGSDIGASLTRIAARVIGREMAKPLSANSELRSRVRQILARHIEIAEKSDLIKGMSSVTYADFEENRKYLSEILRGINE